MSVTFCLPILLWFPSYPWSIRRYPWFLLQYISSVCNCLFSLYVALESTRAVCKWGVEIVVTRLVKIFSGCVRKNILALNLLRQPQARCRFPVRLRILHGTGESSSADHWWVLPHDCNYGLIFNLDLHVRNGFIHFICHELTQMWEYHQGLRP